MALVSFKYCLINQSNLFALSQRGGLHRHHIFICKFYQSPTYITMLRILSIFLLVTCISLSYYSYEFNASIPPEVGLKQSSVRVSRSNSKTKDVYDTNGNIEGKWWYVGYSCVD
jgi:hypothetical protein